MKITNKLNLPKPFEAIAEADGHAPQPHRYSVTELIMPIRAILLRREHYGEIERDVADCVPAMLGSAVHEILRGKDEGDGILAEEPVEARFGEDTVSGRIDRLNMRDFVIEDYKTCSVSKVMKSDFDDWYMQGMAYALLAWKQRGVLTRKLRFYAIMKDWSKIKSATGGNYPQSAVYVWERRIEDSDYDFIERWVTKRLEAINECLSEGAYPECTPEECWNTGDKWAVYKKAGDKRASAVCDSEKEAHTYIAEKCGGVGQIEFRPGEPVKCKYYCDCSRFCKKGGPNSDGRSSGSDSPID